MLDYGKSYFKVFVIAPTMNAMMGVDEHHATSYSDPILQGKKPLTTLFLHSAKLSETGRDTIHDSTCVSERASDSLLQRQPSLLLSPPPLSPPPSHPPLLNHPSHPF